MTDYSHGSTIYGPNDWKEVSEHCIENAQSPINIDTSTVHSWPLPSVFRFIPDNVMGRVTGELVNNGHAPNFIIDNSKGTALLTGAPWAGNEYTLHQLHFHFGCGASKGSEHSVNSNSYAGEVHTFEAVLSNFTLIVPQFQLGSSGCFCYSIQDLFLISSCLL